MWCFEKNNFKITTEAYYIKAIDFGSKAAVTSPLLQTAHKNMWLTNQITVGQATTI